MVKNVYEFGPNDGLYQDLNHFRAILVTGPQRAGTTFVAKAFSNDMDRPFVDESVFGIHDHELWQMMTKRANHCIIQCPSMMKYVHDVPDDVLVVVVRRNTDAIMKSEERVKWSDSEYELGRYGLTEGVISRVKYDWWDRNKHEGPRYWMEIEYTTMSDHPLWVDKVDRAHFGPKQTAP